MERRFLAGLLCALVVAGCGSSTSVEMVCELNDQLAALNERTIPNIEDDLFPEPALLEENFVEGNRLMREMVAVAPDALRSDLTAYVESNEKLSRLYAGFGYDREMVWSTMDEEEYVREYSFDQAGRARIGDWFVEHCSMDLQG